MKKLHKILTFSLLIMLMLSLFSFAGVSNIALAAEGYDSTDVLTDLQSMDGFDLSDYPVNALGEIEIINFSEFGYGYTAAQSEYYALYIYVYNPAQTDIKAGSGQNKLQMAVSYNSDGEPNSYEKFDIQLLSESSDGLFYKYKVIDHYVDGTTFYNRVSASARRYDVSGIELLTKGDINATDYTIAASYTYSGYAAGLGEDTSAESTLNCDVYTLSTIELKVNHTCYRSSGINSLGEGHYNQVNSVYFSVPSSIWNEYDNLQSITAEWWEYKTAPALITANRDLYDVVLEYSGYSVGDYDLSVPFSVYYDIYHVSTSGAMSGYYVYGFAYNINNPTGTENNIEIIPLVFYSSTNINIDGIFALLNEKIMAGDVESTVVADYIYDYENTLENGYINCNGRNLSADLFEQAVDNGRTLGYNNSTINFDDLFNMESYDDTHSWWQKLAAFGIGSGIDTSDGRENVSPIIRITSNDLIGSDDDISSRLLIDKNEVAKLKNYFNNQPAETAVILFRFSVTDYFAKPTGYTLNGEETYSNNSDSYIAQQTVFFEFDIIQLEFVKDGQTYVIAAVSSPIDIINGFIAPKTTQAYPWWVWLVLALSIVAFIILVIVLWPVWKVCLQGLWYVVCLPFRGTAALYHKIRGD